MPRKRDGPAQRLIRMMLPALLLAAPDAPACPVCDSGTGRQVRAGIVDGDLGRNLLATVLPFSVVLGVVAIIHYDPRRKKKQRPPDSVMEPTHGQ